MGGTIYADLIAWIRATGVADLASVVALPIGVIGLFASVMAVLKAKSAATAARQARDAIRTFETIVDFSEAIATLEEIKRLHRQNAWAILPDRYAAIRKLLIQLRASNVLLNESQSSVVQNALVNLRDIERQVERALADPTSLKSAKFNSTISGDIDELLAVFAQLKSREPGGAT